jgi:hypothetical protein
MHLHPVLGKSLAGKDLKRVLTVTDRLLEVIVTFAAKAFTVNACQAALYPSPALWKGRAGGHGLGQFPRRKAVLPV